MGYCGEKAFTRLSDEDGNATYRTYIIDAIHHLSGEELQQNAKIECFDKEFFQ